MQLMLTEGQQYNVQVELANASEVKAIPFGLTANGGITGELKPEGKVFAAKVTTGKLEDKDSYVLKLAVNGKYEIKGITVIEEK
jgi:hypothetical protein